MQLKASFAKILLVFSVLAAIVIVIGPVRLTQASTSNIPTDQVVVRLRSGVNIDTITGRYNATVIGRLIENKVYFLKLGSGQTAAALWPTLVNDTDLVYTELNYYADPPPSGSQSYIDAHGVFPNGQQSYIDAHSVYLDASQSYIDAHGSPSGPADMWAWSKLGLTDAQKISTGRGIIVAVLDTGLAADHPLLDANLIAGYDFVGMTNQIYDYGNGLDDDGNGKIDEGTGHGTHVSGIIVSAAPGVQIMPIRVLNSDGVGTYWEVAAGIRYAVDHGAQVINLSLSAPRLTPSLQEALDYATSHGVIVVTAAGVGADPNYPAAYSNPLILGVGASDRNDVAATFSGGRPIDTQVYAPGVDIFSSYPYNGYTYGSGTSMAAAIVSAEAALLRAAYPDWTPQQVAQRITSKVAPAAGFGPGRVDLVAALSTGLEVRYMLGDIGSAGDAQLKPRFEIMNHTAITIPLSDLKLRYWYTLDGDKPQSFWCDYALVGSSNVMGTFVKVNPVHSGADDYLEVGFTAGAGNLLPGQQSGEIVIRANKDDWTNYNELDDYSYDASNVAYSSGSHVTLYQQGNLIWGSEPQTANTTPSPSPTAAKTATPIPATSTGTSTPISPTATRTNTPVPATAIFTPTPTPTQFPGGGTCAITYINQSDWGNGAIINVTITNSGATAINGWTLTWTYGGNQTISSLWNGTYTQPGTAVSVTNLVYNAALPANGGSVDFGFNVNYSGTNAKPANFKLNGITCQ